MLTKILIPLDGSLCAEHVLAHLPWLGPAETTAVTLLGVISPSYYADGAMNYTTPDLATTAENDTKQYLESHAAQLRDAGYTAATKLCIGDPATEILKFANHHQVDMIAMTTHGRSGFARWVLGSVAERVLQYATVPVFLVREGANTPSRPPAHILVPLDGSKFAEEALATATELATRTKSKVILLNALTSLEIDPVADYVDAKAQLVEATEMWQQEMGAYLSRVAAPIREAGVVVESRLIPGDADKVINEAVITENAGLIIMTTHGRSGLQRWVYGSVANKVLHLIECPLLLVRPCKETLKDSSR